MEMASEWILKKGDRRLDTSCTGTSFKNKLYQAHSIDKTSEIPLCRLCGEPTETVWHIVSGCKKLVQNE